MLLQSERGAKPRVETAKAARGFGAGVFEFRLLLVRRFPTEYSHGNVVRTTQITFHLFLKISEGIEAQVVVETLLIVSVASLDFSIMPRCSGANELVLDLVVITEHIEGMSSLCIREVCKFSAVVRLNDFRSITKEDDCTFYKIYG